MRGPSNKRTGWGILTLLPFFMPTTCAAGALYASDYDSSTIYQISDTGDVSTFVTLPADTNPTGMTFDPNGNLYVGASDTVYKITPGGTISTYAKGLPVVTDVAFDSAGNLFAAGEARIISRITPAGAVSTFVTGAGIDEGLALDAGGNLLVGRTFGSILKITPSGVQTSFAHPSGSAPYVAFDPAGNVYATTSELGGVVKITPDGGAITSYATGTGQSNDLAFDGSGNLFFTDVETGNVEKVGLGGGAASVFASGFFAYGLAYQAPEPSSVFALAGVAVLRLVRQTRSQK